MTRQLILTNKQPLLRSSHAKRPPQSGFVQVGLLNVIIAPAANSGRITGNSEVMLPVLRVRPSDDFFDRGPQIRQRSF
jgi:hypothetical protein